MYLRTASVEERRRIALAGVAGKHHVPYEYTCRVCGKACRVKASRAGIAKYCSYTCAHTPRYTHDELRAHKRRYNREYAKTASGRLHQRASVARYQRRHPEKHRRWSWRWQERTGRILPADYHALCAAIKRLDATLASTEDGRPARRTSQRRLHQALERANRLRNRTDVFGIDAIGRDPDPSRNLEGAHERTTD